GVGRSEARHDRERARGAGPCRARRGRARDRLRDRCQGGAECQGRRRLSGGDASRDHLSGGAHGDRQGRCHDIHRVSALTDRKVRLRDLWLCIFGEADVIAAASGWAPMFALSPDEWVAVTLSLRIALVATLVALPFGIAVAWLLARGKFWGKAFL